MNKNNICDLLKKAFARIWKFFLLSLTGFIATLVFNTALKLQFISDLLAQIIKYQYVYISVLTVCLVIVAVIAELLDD